MSDEAPQMVPQKPKLAAMIILVSMSLVITTESLTTFLMKNKLRNIFENIQAKTQRVTLCQVWVHSKSGWNHPYNIFIRSVSLTAITIGCILHIGVYWGIVQNFSQRVSSCSTDNLTSLQLSEFPSKCFSGILRSW